MARHFAERLARESKDPADQVRRAVRLALGRDATAEEVTALVPTKVLEYIRERGLYQE